MNTWETGPTPTQSSAKATTFSPLERVMNHWQEDLMFGYQFLNGCNPVLIRRCTKLPEKLPVTTEMVECSLERQLTLEQEVEVGPGCLVTSAIASSDAQVTLCGAESTFCWPVLTSLQAAVSRLLCQADETSCPRSSGLFLSLGIYGNCLVQ